MTLVWSLLMKLLGESVSNGVRVPWHTRSHLSCHYAGKMGPQKLQIRYHRAKAHTFTIDAMHPSPLVRKLSLPIFWPMRVRWHACHLVTLDPDKIHICNKVVTWSHAFSGPEYPTWRRVAILWRQLTVGEKWSEMRFTTFFIVETLYLHPYGW